VSQPIELTITGASGEALQRFTVLEGTQDLALGAR
jgi:hypothetical protein